MVQGLTAINPGDTMSAENISDDFIENVTFDELTVGRTASVTRTLTTQDIELFAYVSGDVNPAHLDAKNVETLKMHGVVAHGMWSGALISMVLGTVLPGPGTIYIEQDLRFIKPIRPGDVVTASVTVKAKATGKPFVTFDCRCVNGLGETLVEGRAVVKAPLEKMRCARPELPQIEIQDHDHFAALLELAKVKGPIITAIVHPVKPNAIEAARDAAREGLITPVLIGPEGRVLEAAAAAKIDISDWTLIDVEHSHAAAAKACELAATGKVDAVMKGSLHSDEILGAVVSSSSGLRTDRRISHTYVLDVPSYPKPLLITDAALNIAPDLATKADICQNAIFLWHALFGEASLPKVAILAAVETINSRMPATLEAAALCKMAERGQITGALMDGPLAFDNAISLAAAADKDIVSTVAGDADILVVPDIEAGNMLAKQLTFLGHADAAGIVLGARVPVILTSRADSLRTRLLSTAVAVLLVAARREGRLK